MMLLQVGQLIALSVEEGEDWKDVQIPAPEKKEKKQEAAAASAAPPETNASPGQDESRVGEHKFVHEPNVGPATNLLLTQYGIEPR